MTWLQRVVDVVKRWLWRSPPQSLSYDEQHRLMTDVVVAANAWLRSLKHTPSSPTVEPPPPPSVPIVKTRHRFKYSEVEKARMKHDEFVKPKGTPPSQHANVRSQSEDDPTPPARKFDLTNPSVEELIVDKYHTTGENVLYLEAEIYGEFNFRDTLLEQLPLYWQYLKRMRARDRDIFEFYRQIGITLIPYTASGVNYKSVRRDPIKIADRKFTAKRIEEMKRNNHISDWFHRQRPGFGAVALSLTLPQEAELIINKDLSSPRFAYFAKYERPPAELQPVTNGTVYLLTLWWDDPRSHHYSRKGGAPEEYGVHISADGKTIKVLKQRINEKTWVYPNHLKEWSKQKGIDCNTFVVHMFCDLARQWEASQYSMVRVLVSKDDMSVAFGVAHQRLPYFFKDRDYQLNENGRQIKIIHWVPPFVRKDGVAVKGHFRGNRNFTWAD